MVPKKYNLTIYRHRDYSKQIGFKYTVNGELVPIDNLAFKAQIREGKCSSSNLFAEFDISVHIPTSTITLRLTDSQTALIPEGIAYWDLLVSDGDNNQTYLMGKVKSICTVTEV